MCIVTGRGGREAAAPPPGPLFFFFFFQQEDQKDFQGHLNLSLNIPLIVSEKMYLGKEDGGDCEYELTDLEIQQLKEHNQRKVKRVVALVAICLTVLSLGLVALSLALGKKIDLMVEETMRKQAEVEYLRTGINITENR